MAYDTQPIRTQINTDEVDDANLDILREDLANNKPEMLRAAASELLTAKRRLDSLVGVIDRHLSALDQHWTEGEDASTVKSALRRLRGSAADVSTSISEQPLEDPAKCPANPSGIAPALLMQAHTLSVFSGKNVPESADRDVSVLEGAFQGGVVGTIGGTVGGPPGMVIGAVVGTLAGGVTALFTDGPFGNLIGDSKEEKDRKAAKEHIKLLTEATEHNNRAFPAQLTTDVPQFDALDVRVPEPPFTGADGFDGTVPGGLDQQINSPGTDLNGLGLPNQDGLFDPSLHQIPGLDTGGQNGSYPGTPGLDGDLGSAPGTDLNGAGSTPDAPAAGNLPNAPGTDPNAPRTTLAGLPDPPPSSSLTSPATSHLPNTSGIGSPYGNGPYGGGGANLGNGLTGAANAATAAAALRGSGGRGSPVVPAVPPAGHGSPRENQESTRTTFLLEDEDYFMSDESTTNPFIRGDSKGKA